MSNVVSGFNVARLCERTVVCSSVLHNMLDRKRFDVLCVHVLPLPVHRTRAHAFLVCT
jgi:hypothetical protein